MASLFTHAFVGIALGQANPRDLQKDWRFWLAVIACSILPDVDSIGFYMGVPYGALWGHRGLTHSLLFALVLGFLAALWLDSSFHREWKLAVLLFFVAASHGVLDAMTSGGLGVAFFSPFNIRRYFFPWRPILVSPIGTHGFFTTRGLRILWSEFVWVWCPTLILLAFLHIARSFKSHANTLERNAPKD
ncbi:MAG TPA: metal-dependent hydrolase [Candidatus Angelobacter sp.]|nr:metal-dependent hydrolase [Candidatus Angelobacter sp.]